MYLLHFAGVSHVHDFFVDELLRLRFKLEFTYRTRSFASIHCTGWHFRWLLFTSCLFFVDLLKWLFVWWIDFCSDKHLFQPNVENVHTCHQVFCSSVADYHTYLSYRSSMAQSIFLYFLVEIVRLADWGELMINTTKQTFDFCCFFYFYSYKIFINLLRFYCIRFFRILVMSAMVHAMLGIFISMDWRWCVLFISWWDLLPKWCFVLRKLVPKCSQKLQPKPIKLTSERMQRLAIDIALTLTRAFVNRWHLATIKYGYMAHFVWPQSVQGHQSMDPNIPHPCHENKTMPRINKMLKDLLKYSL